MPRITYDKPKASKTQKKQKDPLADLVLRCPCCQKDRLMAKAQTLLSLEKTLLQKGIVVYQNDEGWTMKRAAKGDIAWACDLCLAEGRAVAAKPWLQVISRNIPDFAYIDRTIRCEDCTSTFIFSTQEQQFWYEKLQFATYSQPRQCAKCRQKRRVYKRYFHDVQRALAVLDADSTEQLANLAELYLKIEHNDKALEYIRRAKNKCKDSQEKAQIEQRLIEIESIAQPVDAT